MPDERKNIKIYLKKERMILSHSIRRRRRYIEVTLGNNDGVRLLLSKEKGVLFDGNKAYLPAENFVLAEFFDRYVNLAFIDYSKVTDTTNKPEKDYPSETACGLLGKVETDALQRSYNTGIYYLYRRFPTVFCREQPENDFARRNKCLPALSDRQEKDLFLPTEPTYQRYQVLL